MTVGLPNFKSVPSLALLTKGAPKGAPARVKGRSGKLPVWVARMSPLVSDETVLPVFGRDGLEARCADRIDRSVRISSVGKWGKSSHDRTSSQAALSG